MCKQLFCILCRFFPLMQSYTWIHTCVDIGRIRQTVWLIMKVKFWHHNHHVDMDSMSTAEAFVGLCVSKYRELHLIMLLDEHITIYVLFASLPRYLNWSFYYIKVNCFSMYEPNHKEVCRFHTICSCWNFTKTPSGVRALIIYDTHTQSLAGLSWSWGLWDPWPAVDRLQGKMPAFLFFLFQTQLQMTDGLSFLNKWELAQ